MAKLFRNGKIYIEAGVFADALLVEDGFIQAVGREREVLAAAGKRHPGEGFDLVDLDGRTVIPGFNDCHLHLTLVGEALRTCDLSDVRSREELIARGRAFLRSHPEITMLIGRGWNQDRFPEGQQHLPTRWDLDEISREIPVILDRVCLHVAAANSKAVELAGVNHQGSVLGGEIHRDASGQATGVFTENAVGLLHGLIPDKTADDLKADFLRAVDYAVRVGITSVQSCDVLMSPDFAMVFSAIGDLAAAGRLKLRYSHQFNLLTPDDLQAYLKTERTNPRYDERWYSRGALKLFKDGSLGGRTALLRQDYQDEPGMRGVEALSDEQLLAFCRLAEKQGIQVLTHAIGDEAIRRVIGVYEEVMAPGNPLRHGIVHNQITTPELLAQIVRLEIPVLAQPIFLQTDRTIIEDRVGPELAETSYAFNTLLEMGGRVGLSTDAPVEDCAPLQNLHWAVNRCDGDGIPAGGYQPHEKMTLERALDAYTLGSAWIEGKDSWKGRLQPGYAADLIILDRDPFTADPLSIGEIQVLETFVGGNSVYRRQELEGQDPDPAV